MKIRQARLIAAALALLTAPLAAEAQPTGKVYRIGWLSTRLGVDAYVDAFRESLRELGYREGENLMIDFWFAGGKAERVGPLVAELVALKPNVIVANGNQVITAAKAATSTIPIVAPWMLDPAGTGLVVSLARPGGNLTGLTFDISPEQGAKRLELLKEVLPNVSQVAIIWNPNLPGSEGYWRELRKLAPAMNLTLRSVEVRGPGDSKGILAVLAQGHPEALWVWEDGVVSPHLRPILDFAAANRIPVMALVRATTEAGALFSYSTSILDLYRRAAVYVGKILKGAKPADLPVEQPTRFELVINLKTAKALDLTIPRSLLSVADQVIQ